MIETIMEQLAWKGTDGWTWTRMDERILTQLLLQRSAWPPRSLLSRNARSASSTSDATFWKAVGSLCSQQAPPIRPLQVGEGELEEAEGY